MSNGSVTQEKHGTDMLCPFSASLDNYRFVGTSLGKHYKEVDFVQEV